MEDVKISSSNRTSNPVYIPLTSGSLLPSNGRAEEQESLQLPAPQTELLCAHLATGASITGFLANHSFSSDELKPREILQAIKKYPAINLAAVLEELNSVHLHKKRFAIQKIKKAFLSAYLLQLHEEPYENTYNRIQRLASNFKLEPREKVLRWVLTGYSGIGFVSGLCGVILRFVPNLTWLEIGIRIIVSLFSMIMEYKENIGQTDSEDQHFQDKIKQLYKDLDRSLGEESRWRLKTFRELERIEELKSQRDQLKGMPGYFPQTYSLITLNEKFEQRLHLARAPALNSSYVTESALQDSKDAVANPSYYPTIRTFFNGSLTLFGITNTILILAGAATVPYLAIALGAAVLINIGIAKLSHDINKRSAQRSLAYNTIIHKNILGVCATREKKAEKVYNKAKKEVITLEKSIAELQLRRKEEECLENKKIPARSNPKAWRIVGHYPTLFSNSTSKAPKLVGGKRLKLINRKMLP